MLIKKDGIYRNIDTKEFGIWQAMGFEKVISEPVKVVEPEPTKEPEPIVEEMVEEPKEEIVVPKPKKKKKA